MRSDWLRQTDTTTPNIVGLDFKTVGFFLKISKEIGKAWRKSLTRAKRVRRIFSVSPQSRSLFSASFQTFCLTARAYLNTQNHGLFCSCFAALFFQQCWELLRPIRLSKLRVWPVPNFAHSWTSASDALSMKFSMAISVITRRIF